MSAKLKRGDWVAVIDGRKALIMANVGDDRRPDLRIVEAVDHKEPPARALGTDAPGRVHESASDRRSAVEQVDRHQQEEDHFVHRLVERLDRAVQSGETAGIVIVAPPRALGVARHHCPERLRRAVRAEIDRDLTPLPTDDIERLVLDALAEADPKSPG